MMTAPRIATSHSVIKMIRSVLVVPKMKTVKCMMENVLMVIMMRRPLLASTVVYLRLIHMVAVSQDVLMMITVLWTILFVILVSTDV
jgi:hypothetical protein